MKAMKQKRLDNSSSEPRAANLTTIVKKVRQRGQCSAVSYLSIVLAAVFAMAVFTHCPSDGGGNGGSGKVQVLLADRTVAENVDTAEVMVTVSAALSAELALEVTTGGTADTATAGTDYTVLASDATVTIATGETSAIISIPIMDDTEPESAETFTVTVSNPTIGGADADDQVTLNRATATVTIQDNDGSGPPPCESGKIDATYSANPQCEGSDAADTFILNAPGLSASALESIDLKGGADSLTIEAANLANIAINLGGGDDSLALNGGTLTRYNGGGADDTLPAAGTAQGGTGADIIVMNGGTITGSITGDGEIDTINIISGSVGGDIEGAGGNNLIWLTGGAIGGSVNGGGNDDLIIINTIDVGLVTDSPTAALNFAAVTDCSNGSSGEAGNQWLCGGAGSDTLKYLAATGSADPAWLFDASNQPRFAGFETYSRCTSIDMTGNRSNDVCSDVTLACTTGVTPCTLNSVYRDDAYSGTVGADEITIDYSFGGAFGVKVDAEGGADVITLEAGTIAHYYGASKATALVAGEVAGGAGEDEFIMRGGSTITAITPADTQADIIRLLDGTFTANQLNLGGGDDTLEIGARFSSRNGINNYYGAMGSEEERNYHGGTGRDTFILSGGTVIGGITGGDEVDIITINSGRLGGALLPGGGNDVITLAGGSVSTNNNTGVNGQGDDDMIIITTTSVVGRGGGSATLTFGSSFDVDCSSSGTSGVDGKQWLCGGAGSDTLKYLIDSTGTTPAWLFDGDDNPRFAEFENYCAFLAADPDSCDSTTKPTAASLSAPRLQQFALAPTNRFNGLLTSALHGFGGELMAAPRSLLKQ